MEQSPLHHVGNIAVDFSSDKVTISVPRGSFPATSAYSLAPLKPSAPFQPSLIHMRPSRPHTLLLTH